MGDKSRLTYLTENSKEMLASYVRQLPLNPYPPVDGPSYGL